MYVVCRCGSYDKQIIVALQELKRAICYKKKLLVPMVKKNY
jgi:hypothetical protein